MPRILAVIARGLETVFLLLFFPSKMQGQLGSSRNEDLSTIDAEVEHRFGRPNCHVKTRLASTIRAKECFAMAPCVQTFNLKLEIRYQTEPVPV